MNSTSRYAQVLRGDLDEKRLHGAAGGVARPAGSCRRVPIPCWGGRLAVAADGYRNRIFAARVRRCPGRHVTDRQMRLYMYYRVTQHRCARLAKQRMKHLSGVTNTGSMMVKVEILQRALRWLL